jgi:hypothetical protein
MDLIKEALRKINTIKLISLLRKTFPYGTYGVDYVSKNGKIIKVFVAKKDVRQELKDRKPKMTRLELEFLKKCGN